MPARTKLNIASIAASIMMTLNVFSKPLHIPEIFQWVLMIGVFAPLYLVFRYIKQLKLEKASSEGAAVKVDAAEKEKSATKKRLFWAMALSVAGSLASPFWLPLTGTTLGIKGDVVVGVITACIVILIIGTRIRKLWQMT